MSSRVEQVEPPPPPSTRSIAAMGASHGPLLGRPLDRHGGQPQLHVLRLERSAGWTQHRGRIQALQALAHVRSTLWSAQLCLSSAQRAPRPPANAHSTPRGLRASPRHRRGHGLAPPSDRLYGTPQLIPDPKRLPPPRIESHRAVSTRTEPYRAASTPPSTRSMGAMGAKHGPPCSVAHSTDTAEGLACTLEPNNGRFERSAKRT